MPRQEFSGQLSLTAAEAARLLRHSRESIHKLCKGGVLKGVWIGNSLHVSTRSILGYMLPPVPPTAKQHKAGDERQTPQDHTPS
jgi:hypothetical protein